MKFSSAGTHNIGHISSVLRTDWEKTPEKWQELPEIK